MTAELTSVGVLHAEYADGEKSSPRPTRHGAPAPTMAA